MNLLAFVYIGLFDLLLTGDPLGHLILIVVIILNSIYVIPSWCFTCLQLILLILLPLSTALVDQRADRQTIEHLAPDRVSTDHRESDTHR